MAFLIDCYVDGAEFRCREERANKEGKPYILCRFEDPSGRSFECTTSDESLFPDVRKLMKADVVTLRLRAVSSQKYSYLSILGVVSGV